MAVPLRECPYCREEVRSDAVKCRYCQSPLTEPKGKDGGDSVTFILDQGLIKFGKFAALILAIFFGFGVYVFGFNLEKAADKLSSAKEAIDKKMEEMNKKSTEMTQTLTTVREAIDKKTEEMNKKSTELNQTLTRFDESIKAADERIKKAERRVTDVQQEVEGHLATIQGRAQLSIEIVAGMEESWRGKQLAEQAQKVTAPDNAGKGRSGNSLFEKKLWKNGITLKIAFLDGDRGQRDRVERVASEWTTYANLKFNFVDGATGTDIRVSFKAPGNWSFVGTEALTVAKDQPTINFGWLTSATDDAEARRVVLHEFGHVLGLIEEMNNPNSDIKWNSDAVNKDLAGPPNHWSKDQIDSIILKRHDRKDYPNYRRFDPKSIMMAQVPAFWTVNRVTVGVNSELSESDKAFARQLYPN